MTPVSGSARAVVKTASLPPAKPCALTPASAPQSQNDLSSRTSWVSRACAMTRCVTRRPAPSG